MRERDDLATERAKFIDIRSYIDLAGRQHLRGEDWNAQKQRVIIRDNWVCQRCKNTIDFYTQLADVHHIRKRSAKGSDDLDNLILIHRDCHKLEHPEKSPKWTANEKNLPS